MLALTYYPVKFEDLVSLMDFKGLFLIDRSLKREVLYFFKTEDVRNPTRTKTLSFHDFHGNESDWLENLQCTVVIGNVH